MRRRSVIVARCGSRSSGVSVTSSHSTPTYPRSNRSGVTGSNIVDPSGRQRLWSFHCCASIVCASVKYHAYGGPGTSYVICHSQTPVPTTWMLSAPGTRNGVTEGWKSIQLPLPTSAPLRSSVRTARIRHIGLLLLSMRHSSGLRRWSNIKHTVHWAGGWRTGQVRLSAVCPQIVQHALLGRVQRLRLDGGVHVQIVQHTLLRRVDRHDRSRIRLDGAVHS
jgi:hypothetical protein